MSELVSRVHKLSDEIIYLKERILEEQRKYADEVDHSDQLAHFLTLLHDGKKCISFCSFATLFALTKQGARRMSLTRLHPTQHQYK